MPLIVYIFRSQNFESKSAPFQCPSRALLAEMVLSVCFISLFYRSYSVRLQSAGSPLAAAVFTDSADSRGTHISVALSFQDPYDANGIALKRFSHADFLNNLNNLKFVFERACENRSMKSDGSHRIRLCKRLILELPS